MAIDFYDGSIMYDFNAHRTLICERDRTQWALSDELYTIALRAAQPERSQRYSTTAQLEADWSKASGI